MQKLIHLALIIAALLPMSSLAAPPEMQSFCGDIKSLFFKEFNGRIAASGVITSIKSFPEKKEMMKKIVLVDPKTIYKIAKVISKSSIQNPEKLIKDLEASDFEWDSYVGEEENPNPYEEDFQVCLSADVRQITKDRQLKEVSEIIDLLEDGFSIKDLLD
jgi:hypothetical protein